MFVRVVHVGDMRMLVCEPFVAMPMRMRLAERIAWSMNVLMVLVVDMRMTMLEGLMDVFVVMLLGQVQPDTEAHEQAGDCEGQRDGLAQKYHRRDCSHEGSRRKVGSCARGPEMAQRHDEERKV